MVMSYEYERKRIDKMKRERDYAEFNAANAKREGGPDNEIEYDGAMKSAGVINRLMKHRGEE